MNKNRCFFILLKFLTIIKANICINHIYFKKKPMNKKQLCLKFFVLIFFFSISKSIQSQNLKLSSPDKLIEIKIQTLNQLKFQVSLKNNVIIR